MLALSLLLFIAFSGCKSTETARTTETEEKSLPSVPDKSAVVIDVGGRKLTENQLQAQIASSFNEQSLQGQSQEVLENARSGVREALIEQFISRSAILNEADRQEIAVSDEERNEAMSRLMSQLPPETTLETFLESYGLTEEEFNNIIEDELKIAKVLSAEVDKLPDPPEKEIKKFYEEQAEQFERPEMVRVRHILVMCDENVDKKTAEEKKSLIEDLHKGLLKGDDFAEIADKYSDCPSGKENGGDLGSFARGTMVQEFEDAAFSQKVDEIGPVVKTKFGYHIIQVLEHNKAGKIPLDDARESICNYLNREKQQEVVQSFVDDLKAKADIKRAE